MIRIGEVVSCLPLLLVIILTNSKVLVEIINTIALNNILVDIL